MEQFAKGFEKGYLRASEDIENDKKKSNGVEIYKKGFYNGQKELLEELKQDIDNGFDAYLINNIIKTKLKKLSLENNLENTK